MQLQMEVYQQITALQMREVGEELAQEGGMGLYYL